MISDRLDTLGELILELERTNADPDILKRMRQEVATLREISKHDIKAKEERVKDAENNRKILEIFDAALEKEEFQVYYQPKVNLKDYKLSGAEGLCRWIHDGIMIYPDEFIPVLEKSGRIVELDFYMLEHVCMQIKDWLSRKIRPVQVSVNLSRADLDAELVLERIIATVDKYKVPHSLIQIELTESVSEMGYDDMRALVYGLSQAGISTAVDDFGTGYSSLKLISELPWNVLKIDKSLLHEAEKVGSNEHMMLSHIIAMVKDIGMECIVEGVETTSDIRLLKNNNCYFAQGFYFDKPIEAEKFEAKLV